MAYDHKNCRAIFSKSKYPLEKFDSISYFHETNYLIKQHFIHKHTHIHNMLFLNN